MSAIKLNAESKAFLESLSAERRQYLIDVIREKAQHTADQMPVLSWCFDDKWPYIERAMKDYRYPPGIRILFHKKPDGTILIDRIAWRCDQPYALPKVNP